MSDHIKKKLPDDIYKLINKFLIFQYLKNKMSSVPNICVDIFSQMANLLTNFQSNSVGNPGTFSHSDGFGSTSTDVMNNQPSGTVTNNFEDQMNNYAF